MNAERLAGVLAGSVKKMKLFARFKPYCLARSDTYFRSRSGVPADARLSRLNREDTKAAKFNPLAGDKRLLHALEDRVYCRLSLGPRQSGTFDNPLYKVLFDQEWSAFLLLPRDCRNVNDARAQPIVVQMVGSAGKIVNGLRAAVRSRLPV